MLLEHHDIIVHGGGYRLKTCSIPRISIQATEPALDLSSPVCVVVTFGDITDNASQVQGRTGVFMPDAIPDYWQYHATWSRAFSVRRFEGPFLEFLLLVLPMVQVELIPEARLKMVVRLGRTYEVTGIFPEEVDAFGLHFSEIDSLRN